MLKLERILLVSAHPDDAVIGAGGTIARLKRENPNCIIWSIYFASCLEDPRNKNVPEEYANCSKILEIDHDIEYKMPRDYLENCKQKIRDILWNIREKFKPNIVFCPSTHDFHQDHKGIAECCQTIFRETSTILAFEIFRSVMPTFQPSTFFILSDMDIEKKISALKEYKSQFEIKPNIFDLERIKSIMIARGSEVNSKWAESFEMLWGRI